MSNLHEMFTGERAKPTITKYDLSPRHGKHTKTMAKTARARGFNYTPVFGWRARKVGESGTAYAKRTKAGIIKQAAAAEKGDKVTI